MRNLALLAAVALVGCSAPAPSGPTIDVTAQLLRDAPQVLQLGPETHTFTMLQGVGSRAILRIQSEPQVWPFAVGVPQQLDLNGEGGPEVVVTVTEVTATAVTMHVQDISSAGEGSRSPPGDPWATVTAVPEPEGTPLLRLTLRADQEPQPYLYELSPAKDACDLADSTLYDGYVAETGGKMRIRHLVGSSAGFPTWGLQTIEDRPRLGACANGGQPLATNTELMLDEKRPVDLDGNGTPDVDAVLRQVQQQSGPPTMTVLIYSR